MSHLNSILSKTDQIRRFGPALPHCICLRYQNYKKSFGLKLVCPSPLEQYSHDRNSPVTPPNDRESRNVFGSKGRPYPKLDRKILQDINTVAGISVTTYSLGWCRINLKEKTLIDFGSVLLSLNKYKNPYQPDTIFKVVKTLRMMLPIADLYILENFRVLRNKEKNFDPVEIQLLSMLTVMLNTFGNGELEERNKVLFQNRAVIDYLYELNVKSERTSAGQKLQRALNDVVPPKNVLSDDMDVNFGNIKINLKSDFVDTVFSSQPLKRDSTALAFFLALSFIEMNKDKIYW